MNELELKYGCNPNQKPSRIFMANGADLPIEVLNGRPGYINFMDAFNGWQLVKELKKATGQVMAILSMLYPIWSYDISLHPDFENKVMAGRIYMRGRIRVFTLIRIAWRVYFNKNLKKVLVMLQKGGTKHG